MPTSDTPQPQKNKKPVQPAPVPENPESTGDLSAAFLAAEEAPLVQDRSPSTYLEEEAVGEAGEVALATGEPVAAEGRDSGLGAGFPFLAELADEPGLPEGEVPVPPAEAMSGAPLFSPAAYLEPEPVSGQPGAQAPTQAEEQSPDTALVDFFVTEARLQALWDRADAAKQQIDIRILSLQIARPLLDLIQNTRNELMGRKDRYEEAERFLNEVEFRIGQAERMHRWSAAYGLGLFLYELLWAASLGWLLLGYLRDAIFTPGAPNMTFLIGCAVWGGFGGVVGAWLSLVKHIAIEQDFDRQHTIWYINSPLMGLGVGAVIFLFVMLGLLTVSSSSISPYVAYAFAFLAGYQHNVFTDIVKRVLKVLESGASGEKDEKK